MFARFGGGDDLIGMARIFGVHHHHVDIVAADKFAPIVDELLDAEAHCRGAAARLIVVGDGDDARARQFPQRLGSEFGVHMRPTDHSDAQLLRHASSPSVLF